MKLAVPLLVSSILVYGVLFRRGWTQFVCMVAVCTLATYNVTAHIDAVVAGLAR